MRRTNAESCPVDRAAYCCCIPILLVALLGNHGLFAADRPDESPEIREIFRRGGYTMFQPTLPNHTVTAISFHDGSNFSDIDLPMLKHFDRLTMLSLRGTKTRGTRIVGGGMAELGHLKNLTSLDLENTRIGDDGIRQLTGLTELTVLDLSRTLITDTGLKDIGRFKKLKFLYLKHTAITDVGMKQIGQLKSLEGIGLVGTQVTDAGLKELADLKRLKAVGVGETQVTETGLQQLKLSLPNVSIFR